MISPKVHIDPTPLFAKFPKKERFAMDRNKTRRSLGFFVAVAAAFSIFLLAPIHGWAGENAGPVPRWGGLVASVPGQIVLKNVLPYDRGQEPTDLTRYFPLNLGSSWTYKTYLYDASGWHVYTSRVSVVDTRDMGGGVVASAVQYPGGEIEWLGWSSLGLLLFSEEESGWSGVYRVPQYVVYSSMEPGAICSGSSIVDLFMEPQHTFYGTATSSLSHTFQGMANVSLPIGDFLDSAIVSYESQWQEPGYPEYEKGLLVLGRDVGPIFIKAIEVWSEQGVPHWDFFLSVLSDYTIGPP